jgi:UDP-GlcNAc:undecaprenyl-phosphate GlcNAc-1-phosphate transferase
MSVPDWLTHPLWLFACPLAISWLLTAGLIRWAPRLGLVDYPSERKVHTRPTPRGGGLAIFGAVALTLALSSICNLQFAFFNLQFFLSLAIVLLGLLDDLRPLPWPVRLAVQLAVAALAVILCAPPAPWPVRAAAVLWVAGLVNAFNMLDNMDALSGGVAWIAAGFLALALMLGAGGPRPYLVLMGALSGFLWFNRPPARIFMGDAGSTFLGFTIGLGGVQVGLREGGPVWSWAVPVCIAAVPCYDLVSVVTLRLSQGRSPFHADKQHLSHRLVGRGLSPPAAVRLIHLLALASGANGLILYAVASEWAAVLVGLQLLAWWIALAVIEFGRRPTAAKESCHEPQTQGRPGGDPGGAAGL